MSGENEQTETEAAEATEAGQETAPPESAEAADDFETEWQKMVAQENGEPETAEAAADADDPDSTEAATGTAEGPSDGTAAQEGSEAGETEPADKDPDSTEAAAETGEEPDGDAADVDWDALPAAAKSAFEAEKARADRAEHSFKSRQGREAALQRRLDEHLAASGEKPEQATARSQDTGTEPAVSEEAQKALTEFETEFPDIAQPLLKHVIGPLTALVYEQRQRITKLETGLQTVGEDRLDAASAEQERIVVGDHPDYDDIADSDEFVAWAEAQPEFIRQGIMANAENIVDGAAVSKILTMYKEDNGIANGKGNGVDAGEDPPADRNAAGDTPPVESKPAADPVRKIQLASSRGTPAPSPGPPAREDTGTRTETEADVWAQLRAEEERKIAAEARA